jgi:hypothetical protein
LLSSLFLSPFLFLLFPSSLSFFLVHFRPFHYSPYAVGFHSNPDPRFLTRLLANLTISEAP